ncbi:uncharacterized protein V6R79_008047 [Siganus canaliculatus]
MESFGGGESDWLTLNKDLGQLVCSFSKQVVIHLHRISHPDPNKRLQFFKDYKRQLAKQLVPLNPTPTSSFLALYNRRNWGQSADLGLDLEHQVDVSLFTFHDTVPGRKESWTLNPVRPILVIGASNVGRLPQIRDPRVQLDCFPAANIHYATHIITFKMPLAF